MSTILGRTILRVAFLRCKPEASMWSSYPKWGNRAYAWAHGTRQTQTN